MTIGDPIRSGREETGRVVSINVGLPRGVDFRGRRVHTGIWKQPVVGPICARRYNLDGDRQGDSAAHGGEHRAVLLYQLDSYRYWQRALGRDPFGHGMFGENLTVDGLADADVRIGDRYRIGEALFEVTQPRVTCFRVGIRLDEPRMPALMVRAGRPGFYMRVIEEGGLQAGDRITCVARGPAGVTVAAVDALLYLPDPAIADLRRALTADALSKGWRESLATLLAEAEGHATAPAFRPMRIGEAIEETADVRSLVLAPDDGDAPWSFEPGQSVTLRFAVESGACVERTYSISGRRDGNLRISVKRGEGEGSRHLRDRACVGDRVAVTRPEGAFTLTARPAPLFLVSAGIGLTPVLAILHRLADTRDPRPIHWMHGARNGRDHVLAAEVTALLGRLPNACRKVFYSRPLPADVAGRDYDEVGRIDAASLDAPDGAEVYLCGPPALVRSVQDELEGRDLSVHTEAFDAAGGAIRMRPGEPPHAPDDDAANGAAIRFADSGVTARFGAAYGSLLELAEACNVPVRWSCRTGVCHRCETRLLDGAVDYDPKPARAPAPGNVLICCATPRGDVELAL